MGKLCSCACKWLLQDTQQHAQDAPQRPISQAVKHHRQAARGGVENEKRKEGGHGELNAFICKILIKL